MIESIVASKLFWVSVIAFGTLGIGTAIRLTALRGRIDKKAVDRRNSLKTWWGVVVIIIGIAIVGRDAAIVVFGILSLLAFLEFMRMKPTEVAENDPADNLAQPARANSNRQLVTMGMIFIPLHYLSLWLNRPTLALALLPVAALISGGVLLIVRGQVKGYVSQLGHAYLGLMFTTYLLSHVVLLFATSGVEGSRLDAAACFLYVVALTELDDITQALVGRRVGKRKLSPVVSPNKTWEGFLGGMAVTVVLSIILGRYLITSTWYWSMMYGIIIAIAGLFGDLNMSAVKRDAGVKDSGNWLPGHGGLLDRIDSLMFTAPVFYYLYVQPMSS